VTAFLAAESRRLAPRRFSGWLATALRSLLRFWHVEGLISEPLDRAVPKVANRRPALPRGLEPAQVRALLASCDRRTAAGNRDLAMLVLLARMGLRAGEVAGLGLDDVEWWRPAAARRRPSCGAVPGGWRWREAAVTLAGRGRCHPGRGGGLGGGAAAAPGAFDDPDRLGHDGAGPARVAPRPDWPGRAEAAVGLPVIGLLGVHGGSRPVPIASLAKIMTADIVLRGHPLPVAGPGPVIAVAAADAAAYARDQRQGQSVVKVAAGEKLTERQALEAMLIASGNNIAALLARWDAGSEAAFVARMNARARQLGLRGTRYADASGADPATVSTASGQFRLTVAALQIPAFRQIVALPQVTLPVAGVAYNVNAGLGHDGITGVKTGSSSRAGGCLAFAAIRTVAGSPVTIVGVVLGVRPTAARPRDLGGVISAAENLLGSVGGDLEHAQVRSSGPALSWGACPARGPPGPPRSRPPGSA
jgi:hypothetical protein